MTKFKLLGVALLLTSTLATPVMAKDMGHHRSHHAAMHHDRMARHAGNWDRDSGFRPGDVAAGVVGGALATAGAIATAPFGGNDDAYAYDNSGWNGYNNGYNNGYSQSYAERNGFVCMPGSWFRGQDGRQHICQ